MAAPLLHAITLDIHCVIQRCPRYYAAARPRASQRVTHQVRRTPSVCVLHVMGDRRSGKQLLDDAPADALISVPSLSRTPAGARLARSILEAFRARFLAYVRAAGALESVATLDVMAQGPPRVPLLAPPPPPPPPSAAPSWGSCSDPGRTGGPGGGGAGWYSAGGGGAEGCSAGGDGGQGCGWTGGGGTQGPATQWRATAGAGAGSGSGWTGTQGEYGSGERGVGRDGRLVDDSDRGVEQSAHRGRLGCEGGTGGGGWEGGAGQWGHEAGGRRQTDGCGARCGDGVAVGGGGGGGGTGEGWEAGGRGWVGVCGGYAGDGGACGGGPVTRWEGGGDEGRGGSGGGGGGGGWEGAGGRTGGELADDEWTKWMN